MSKNKITTIEMEHALAVHFNYRQNTIVPNVSWGMDVHECDLFVLSAAGYVTEVEIKISAADLKKDAQKWHGHINAKIKKLYFAIPDYLDNEGSYEHIPERAGVIVVDTGPLKESKLEGRTFKWPRKCKVARPPVVSKSAPKLDDEQRMKLLRLGALRIWRLKEKIIQAA